MGYCLVAPTLAKTRTNEYKCKFLLNASFAGNSTQYVQREATRHFRQTERAPLVEYDEIQTKKKKLLAVNIETFVGDRVN